MSWPQVKLEDLVEINIGRTPSRNNSEYWGEGIPWLSIRDMNQGKYFTSTAEEITEKAVKETKCKIAKKGTVLFSFKLSIGKVGIAEIDIFHNEAIAAMPIKQGVELCEEYLYFALLQLDSAKDTDRAVMGATLNKKKMAELKIPLPPLETQKQIAAVLEKADQLRKDCKLMEQELNSLAQSVFIDMFGDLRKEGKYKSKVSFEEIYEISSKLVDPRLERYELLPHIGPEHLEKITGRILPYRTAKEDGLVSGKFHFKRGCVLFSKIRPNLKKVAIPDFDGLCSADMYPLEPIEGVSTKEFIWGLILSLTFDEYLQLLPSRANIPKINRKELSAFEFYLPDLEDQIEYSKKLKHVQCQIEMNRNLLKVVGTNFNSLMQKAFKGELKLEAVA